MKLYTGVGSRRAPQSILELAEALAIRLRHMGWVCRSGHAAGMDQAFERGAREKAEVYLPWPSFNEEVPILADNGLLKPTAKAFELGRGYHPTGWGLKHTTQALMARNVHQVLGQDLATPSAFVVCWTPDGSLDGESDQAGGTGQALRVAAAWRVPVFNLAREDHLGRCRDYARSTA